MLVQGASSMKVDNQSNNSSCATVASSKHDYAWGSLVTDSHECMMLLKNSHNFLVDYLINHLSLGQATPCMFLATRWSMTPWFLNGTYWGHFLNVPFFLFII